MAAQLSDVDFNRMQDQLLELRESYYKTEEKCKKQERELNATQEQLYKCGRDLNRANQIITKSKKAKDYELALNEIDSLRLKLQSHEDDFRIQNEALMRELGQLVTTNEQLEQEIATLKTKDDNASATTTSATTTATLQQQHQQLQDELRRMQAQYTAIVKRSGRHSFENIEKQSCETGDGDDVVVHNDKQSTNERQDTSTSTTTSTTTTTTTATTTSSATSPTNIHEDSLTNSTVQASTLDFELRLSIEKEENKLLKKQIMELQNQHADINSTLKQEVDKLNEKLKKKQESLLQLQESKDLLYNEMNQKLQSATDALTANLSTAKSNHDLEMSKVNGCLDKLERENQALRGRLVEVDAQRKELTKKLSALDLENERNVKDIVADCELNIKKHQNNIKSLQEQVKEYKSKLEDYILKNTKLSDEVDRNKVELDKQADALKSVTELADSRKKLLDQLSIKLQEVMDSHRETMKKVNLEHGEVVQSLNKDVDDLKTRLKELATVENECTSLRERLKMTEELKRDLEKKLIDLENELQTTKETNEQRQTELQTKRANDLERMNVQMKELTQSHVEKIKSKEMEIVELEGEISKFENIVKDHTEDKRLHEKKGNTVIKDLKKQLQMERKRCERLQDKLQEVLSDSKNRQSLEDLFRPVDDKLRLADNSSLSSWSPSGISSKEYIVPSTDDDNDQHVNWRVENEELIRRSEKLQRKVAMLEEKVSHLESSNASMAEDLLEKSAVIEHYHMNNKAGQTSSLSHHHHPHPHHQNNTHDKLTLKRVVDFVIDKTDDNLKDMNKKLQRILEETLTKNMHLQNDLEKLSLELTKLKSEEGAS